MEMNRRNLLKGSVAMGAAGLVASKAAVAAVPAKWDETVDIVVIGSGFAGLAAAIEAKKAGSNVIVLEKMPTARRKLDHQWRHSDGYGLPAAEDAPH